MKIQLTNEELNLLIEARAKNDAENGIYNLDPVIELDVVFRD
jgi:hypothetical protein